MIDPNVEDLLTLTAACGAFPGRRVGLATLHRWRLSGVRGCKLQTILVGGQRFTSRQAIARFIEAQNEDQAQPGSNGARRQVLADAAQAILQRELRCAPRPMA
jgi:hypothetical protein